MKFSEHHFPQQRKLQFTLITQIFPQKKISWNFARPNMLGICLLKLLNGQNKNIILKYSTSLNGAQQSDTLAIAFHHPPLVEDHHKMKIHGHNLSLWVSKTIQMVGR